MIDYFLETERISSHLKTVCIRKIPVFHLGRIAFIVAVLLLAMASATKADTRITTPPGRGTSAIINHLQRVLSTIDDGQTGRLDRKTARSFYLEEMTRRNNWGDSDFCTRDRGDRLISQSWVPVAGYKGIIILGSPYSADSPGKKAANINDVFVRETLNAIKAIDSQAPRVFKEMSESFRKNGGYVTLQNFCDDNGLTYGKFNAMSSHDSTFFMVMLSSTLFLHPEFFNEFDIASTLVHEVHGHARGHYINGETTEAEAFTTQMKFAALVGDDKFLDVGHKSGNLKFRIKMTLSNTGGYVENPGKKVIRFYNYSNGRIVVPTQIQSRP